MFLNGFPHETCLRVARDGKLEAAIVISYVSPGPRIIERARF